MYSSNVNIFIGLEIGDIYSQIDLIKIHMKNLQKLCRDNCSIRTEVDILQAKVNKLTNLGIQLLLTYHRQKRGLIDAMGSVSKSLFGTLDANDLTIINANIDKLFDEGNQLKSIVANQTALIRRIISTDSLKQFDKLSYEFKNLGDVREDETLTLKLIITENTVYKLQKYLMLFY